MSLTKPTALWVHVQPRAKKTEVTGWYGDAVKIRVHAPPVGGAANDELVRFIAKQTGLPRSSVSILSGAAGRRKLVTVDGLKTNDVLDALGLGD